MQAVTVNRVGGNAGVASVDYNLVAATATAGADYTDTSGTLTWADGESTAKTFTIDIIDDSDDENNETFSVQLTGVSGSSLGSQTSLIVTISDNETNTAPSVTINEDFEANTLQTVNLSATVSDPEQDPVTYLWEQVSGPTVSLNSTTQSQASFVTPDSASTLTMRLTVTDNKGAASGASVVITVVEPTVEPDDNSSSGGGSFGGLLMVLFLVTSLRRKYSI